MRDGSLTLKQQAKARVKAFRILASIGFQQAESPKGAYWWRKVGGYGNGDQRVCVGFDVENQCLGGRTGWVWQIAPLDKEPLFGYSGTSSIGSQWCTVERVIEATIEQIYRAGSSSYGEIASKRIAKAKEIVSEALAAL